MKQRNCPFCSGTITSWQPASWNHSSPACYQFHDFDYFDAFGALVAKMHGTTYELVYAGQLRMLSINSAALVILLTNSTRCREPGRNPCDSSNQLNPPCAEPVRSTALR